MPRYRRDVPDGPGRWSNNDTWMGLLDAMPELFERDDNDPIGKRIWEWADKLIDSKRLRQADMYTVQALMRACYDAGKADGLEEAKD